ncbi:MAG: hypothetical protein ICV31_00580 [Rubrobacter sp.]|nr:hypothetical protein [Rubrobacter sp.]
METESTIAPVPAESSGGPRLLRLAAFFSSFDRVVVGPMLLTISSSPGPL